MKTQIEIKAVGSGLNFSPPGVDIVYGYNMIPYAAVQLTPEHLKMLCNFEQFRRKPITISVRTEKDCLRFDGLMDGISFQQTRGSITFTMIVKSRFQVLTEIYPRLPGLHPASQMIFTRGETLTVSADSASYMESMQVGDSQALDTSKNVIAFLVDAIKKFIENQQLIEQYTDSHPDAYKIVEIAKEMSKVTLPLAQSMMEKVNTSYVEGTKIIAADYIVSNFVMQQIVDSHDNLFNTLITTMGELGCAVVMGNDTIYVVPEVGYLKQPHTLPVPSSPSNKPNIVYPSQYDFISFDDQGHKDIKAVYVTSDENATYLNGKLQIELGGYIDPDPNVTGGVLTLNLPKAVAMGAAGMYYTEMYEAQKGVKENIEDLADVLSAEEIAEEIKKVENQFEEKAIDVQRRFLNNWAQLKYLQAKFTDRTGTFTTMFNPNFAPAACGTIYTRYPGMYIDYFVTSVTHSFAVNPPADGHARTTVRFNSARMGSSQIGQGLDKVDLFDYSADTANLYALNFVSDVTKKFE